ncbi:SEC10/PgrA surface exclusion domain-containing protein [Lactobacillus sp. LL6]|uniref:SEC10/PgrA surface exclusion domain-containing protein n=1 Tax=Lactobacillus sp. LL6 TaxID=2596827 RepID=UPI0011860D78|nr:SEC10/PgrA surface exclusion domain-containing protein [Lactobacillus sp. LL6]TSO26425.1 SEC10/PgrA surface exclusion domain-containing protein [Lactobacillus sp. LL6]
MKKEFKFLAIFGIVASFAGFSGNINNGHLINIKTETVQAAVTSSITLPKSAGYTKSNILRENEGTISKANRNKLIKGSIAGMKENKFIDTDTSDNRSVDVLHLSHSDQVEISKYTLSLINSARRQMGKRDWTYSDNALKFANRVALEYTNNNKSCWDPDHYVAGIKRAAKASGLSTIGQVYEDESGLPITSEYNGHTRTMKVLKEQIYFNVKQMLFGGFYGSDNQMNDASRYVEWEHAGDLLGLRSKYDAKTKLFGVSFSSLKDDDSKISVHMIGVAKRYIKNYKKFNK